jgi:16S rRNA (cytosine967-C5)-methyltransferase
VRPSPTSRTVALDLLTRILEHRQPLDEAIAGSADFEALAVRDRAAARMLTATVLRRLGQLDELVDRCLERPLPHKARPVRRLLHVGIAQLLFLGTAPHAALDTTVDLARRAGFERYAGLVNAILRRLSREGTGLLAAQDEARLNTPDWLWESWSAAYGRDTARAIATAHLAEPALDITVKADPESWAQRLGAEILPTGTLRLHSGGRIPDLPGFADGAWWVQDAAAGLPARLVGPVAGLEVVDLCAAPGGKTVQLAAAGARVTAVDRSPRRLALLTDNMRRLHLAAETVVADATVWRPSRKADAVLLDAPCTATGTIRRHPDIAWLKSPSDVTVMAALQDRLLDAAVDMVRPGGLVVFCTCSLQPEEGPDRIARLISSNRPVEPVAVSRDDVGDLDELLSSGCLRTLPCHFAAAGGMDGFFAARLRIL